MEETLWSSHKLENSLLVVSKARYIDLKQAFRTYECSVMPSGLFAADSSHLTTTSRNDPMLIFEGLPKDRQVKEGDLTRFNKICHPSQRPRWQVDKEAIGLSRVQQRSSTYSPPS